MYQSTFLDNRHAPIASGRVSGSSARVSAQRIRRHRTRDFHRRRTRTRIAVSTPGGGERRAPPPPRPAHTAQPGDTNGCPVFPPVLRAKGGPVCEAVDTIYEIRDTNSAAFMCPPNPDPEDPERSPSRPSRVDVLGSHVKRPDVGTSGYSGKPRHITGDEERDNAYDRPSAAWRVAARGARHDRHFAS